MRRATTWLLAAGAAIVAAAAAQGQLLPGLPALPTGIPGTTIANDVAGEIGRGVDRTARMLEQVRRDAVAQLVRDHPDAIALDPDGFPARAGELVVEAPDEALLSAVAARGYTVIERDDVLGVGFVRLRAPAGRSLTAAIRDVRKLGGAVSADPLHMPSGLGMGTGAAPPATGAGTLVGVIDGGVDAAAISQGFASGAPRANDHGTAVASLIAGSGPVRGALPGARIVSADVYGSDPAGGNATAIARALGWMVERHVPVVTISLVGPPNPTLARVIAAAQARGLVIVAAVGNNGPAAPPAYPASYPGVIAVTAVDARDRPLIEAGRATHLDFAAPGADMLAAGVDGRAFKVRGTSFAAPLVAGTIAGSYPVPAPARIPAALARVAADAKKTGNRKMIGRGIVCDQCRTPAR